MKASNINSKLSVSKSVISKFSNESQSMGTGSIMTHNNMGTGSIMTHNNVGTGSIMTHI